MRLRWWRKLGDRIWRLIGGVSVRTKIFGIVLGSTLLLSVSFTLQTRHTLASVFEQKSREQGISIARDIAARSTDLILINDLYSLHQLLTETQENYTGVRYAFIINSKGKVLVHTFKDGLPKGLKEVNSSLSDEYQSTVEIRTNEGKVWDVGVPIFGGRAGTARVGISGTSVRQALNVLSTRLGVTIVLVLIFSLSAATFLTWVLTKPILGLVEATNSIGEGDFSFRVKRWANDEIGQLADAFNQMAAQLGHMDEIRQERENLRRQLLEKVITAQEDERRRISRELHDSTSQSLTSLKVNLRTLQDACQYPQAESQFENLRDVVDETLEEIHTLAVQLRPTVLDDLGLAAALDRYLNEWQQQYNLSADMMVHLGGERLPGAVETSFYRIIQEALTNVARHAGASSVSVLIERQDQRVVAVIEDDGKGFNKSEVHRQPHLGLLGIRERTELLGGTLTVETAPGKGTSLFVRIPLT